MYGNPAIRTVLTQQGSGVPFTIAPETQIVRRVPSTTTIHVGNPAFNASYAAVVRDLVQALPPNNWKPGLRVQHARSSVGVFVTVRLRGSGASTPGDVTQTGSLACLAEHRPLIVHLAHAARSAQSSAVFYRTGTMGHVDSYTVGHAPGLFAAGSGVLDLTVSDLDELLVSASAQLPEHVARRLTPPRPAGPYGDRGRAGTPLEDSPADDPCATRRGLPR